jgi:hypothetical protein
MKLVGREALARRCFAPLDGTLDVVSRGMDLDAARRPCNHPARHHY